MLGARRRHLQSCLVEQADELVEVAAGEVGAEQRTGLGSCVAGGHLDERSVRRLLVEVAGHEHGDRAAGGGDPAHLPDRSVSVGEEHEGHLAHDGVEGAVGEREGGNVTLAPVDVGTHASGHGEHGLVEVDADDVGRPDEVGGGAGDDPRPACDIQHPLAGDDAGGLAQGRCPLGEEGGHECGLVGLGGLDGDLERLGWFGGGGHGAIIRRSDAGSIGQLTQEPSGFVEASASRG